MSSIDIDAPEYAEKVKERIKDLEKDEIKVIESGDEIMKIEYS